MPAARFVEALNDQVANEFAASHQYTAIVNSSQPPSAERLQIAPSASNRGLTPGYA